MKSFREYYEDKEHERLDEDLSTAVITGLFGIPATLVLGYGASWLTYRYARMTKNLVIRLVKTWKNFKSLFQKDDAEEKIDKTLETISKSAEVQKAVREVDKLKEKYAGPLESVYEAIEKKNSDSAENMFKRLEEKYQNNPEVRTALVDKILESYNQPPIYIASPGNETYQAIKKILGQKTARAVEELTKQSFSHYFEQTTKEEG